MFLNVQQCIWHNSYLTYWSATNIIARPPMLCPIKVAFCNFKSFISSTVSAHKWLYENAYVWGLSPWLRASTAIICKQLTSNYTKLLLCESNIFTGHSDNRWKNEHNTDVEFLVWHTNIMAQLEQTNKLCEVAEKHTPIRWIIKHMAGNPNLFEKCNAQSKSELFSKQLPCTAPLAYNLVLSPIYIVNFNKFL